MPDNDRPHFWIPDENVRNEGFIPHGGGKSYSREDFASHGQKLIRQIREVTQIVVSKADEGLTTDYIVQIKSPENRPIKNEKLKLGNLGFEIISYSPTSSTSATALIDKSKFRELFGKVEQYTVDDSHPGKTNISILEEIGDVPIEEKIEETLLTVDDAEVECIFALYNILSISEKDKVLNSLSDALIRSGVESTKKKTFLSGVSILSAKVKPSLMRELGQAYITVKSITKNSKLIIQKSTSAAPLPNPLNLKPPSTKSIVAVVDSGVANKSPALEGLVIDRLPFLPPTSDSISPEHGTLVASRIIYGDFLETPGHWLEPICRIVDVPVFGMNSATGEILGPSEDELIATLDTVVSHLQGAVRMFNLSLGSEAPIRKNFYSLLASEIDYLSRKFDVLFIISSGNILNWTEGFPRHFEEDSSQIQPPAESLLGLSVGSFAKYGDSNCLSRANEVSPFSCRGPGVDLGVKPELVAHGGNLLANWEKSPRYSAYGIFSDGATLAYDVGTSFSAPIISSYAARLFDAYPDASPNLVKALLCQFADPILVPNTSIEDKYFFGCGHPNIDAALYNAQSSATFVRQGKIKKDTYQYLKFQVPSCLSSSSENAIFKLKITLIYNPPVNPDNHLEYSKSRITMSIQKRTQTGLKSIGTGGAKRNFILAWNPLIHFEKEFSRSYATGEWEVRLRLMTRGKLPEEFLQDYAIVIQVMDSSGNQEVYKEILNGFRHIYTPISLKVAA